MPELLFLFETDCPTCRLSVPYLNRLSAAWQPQGRVRGLSQDPETPTDAFVASARPVFDVEIDRDWEVSRRLNPGFVPALFLVEGDEILWSTFGFSKEELNDLAARLGLKPIADDFDGNPSVKAGCSSRHLEPEAEGDLVEQRPQPAGRASRIDIPDTADAWDHLRQLLGEPLPVVPPTESRVERMLAACPLPPDEVVALVPPNYGAATVEKIAANAVMAGCDPALMRVLIPLIRAACDEKFNLHGVQATTHFAAPIVVLGGPVIEELGFWSKGNVFSNVAKANSSLGRAFQLILTQIGGARAGEIDMSALGNPLKFSAVIAENQEQTPWEPLRVAEGFKREDSTLTLFACDPPRGVSEHQARSPETLLRAFCPVLNTVWTYRACGWPEAFVVLCPEHAQTLRKAGWARDQVIEFLWANTGVPVRDFDTEDGEGIQMQKMYEKCEVRGEICYRKFNKKEQIKLVVSGGTAGKFSAVLGSWQTGPRGSQMVTYPIRPWN